MSKKITDKIKEILTPKDLKIFEDAIESMVQEKVQLAEEELKNKYDKIAEDYVSKKVVEELDGEKAKLVEDYDAKLNALEKKVVTKLDSFLDHVITEQISDENLEKIALNEVALPVIEGIKKVFTENYVELESEGSKLIESATAEKETLEAQLSESIAKNMELEERLEKTASYLLISEKTDGLAETQKKRVVEMFKGKAFDEIKEKIDTFVEMVKETSKTKRVVKETKEHKTVDTVITEDDHIKEEKKTVLTEDDAAPSVSEVANNYL